MTYSRRLEYQPIEDAFEEVESDARSSIELAKMTKGYNWTIKRYWHPGEDLKEVEAEIDGLNERYQVRYGEKQ